jgi:predicted PurR-regulated permease PerM
MAPQRRNRLILVIALVLLVCSLLWAARGELFPFVFALVLAYVMLPLVNLLDRGLRRLAPRFGGTRGVAVLITYLISILLVVAFFRLLLPVIGQQFSALWGNRREIASAVQELADRGLVWYRETVPADIQTQIDAAVRQAGARLGGTVQTGLVQTISAVTNTVTFVIGLVIVPIWLFYVLNEQSRFMRAAVQLVPESVRSDVVNVVRIADRIFSKYLRGQLILCVVVGAAATLGLTLLGVRFPVVLGVVAGVFEILPFYGPIIGAVPAVLVALIQQPLLAVWTIVLFLVIQQMENVLLVPRISGKAVELHPALIAVVLIIGSRVAGVWGAILAVPLTAIIRDVFKYLYLRFLDQPVEPKEALARISKAPLQLDV